MAGELPPLMQSTDEDLMLCIQTMMLFRSGKSLEKLCFCWPIVGFSVFPDVSLVRRPNNVTSKSGQRLFQSKLHEPGLISFAHFPPKKHPDPEVSSVADSALVHHIHAQATTSNRCHASSNRCLTSSNKKLPSFKLYKLRHVTRHVKSC